MSARKRKGEPAMEEEEDGPDKHIKTGELSATTAAATRAYECSDRYQRTTELLNRLNAYKMVDALDALSEDSYRTAPPVMMRYQVPYQRTTIDVMQVDEKTGKHALLMLASPDVGDAVRTKDAQSARRPAIFGELMQRARALDGQAPDGAFQPGPQTLKMINAQDAQGETALSYCASARESAMVQLLLSARADPNIRRHKDGSTALVQCLRRDDLPTRNHPKWSIITALLNHGADPRTGSRQAIEVTPERKARRAKARPDLPPLADGIVLYTDDPLNQLFGAYSTIKDIVKNRVRHASVLAAFLRLGVDVDIQTLPSGTSPLMRAVASMQPMWIASMLPYISMGLCTLTLRDVGGNAVAGTLKRAAAKAASHPGVKFELAETREELQTALGMWSEFLRRARPMLRECLSLFPSELVTLVAQYRGWEPVTLDEATIV